MATKKEVVLVTGSSGCLGQHIVKLLQERCDNVSEIRLYDKREYVNKLGEIPDQLVPDYMFNNSLKNILKKH